ncbi:MULTISPECIES: hypothetical protein [Pseudomonas putida group]|uniref:hypothetical protein n=1 Tax=Pseudomonas putida group TaxID=136845 RepID=UPI0018AA31B1|nr:hypothetical protein [Pseudomonas monteilii]MBF8748747.1 hypothetical protein [Pseudomonas monteilii]
MRTFNVRGLIFWLVLLCGGWPLQGNAVEIDVKMRYRGDPSGRFENVTPPGDYCAVWPHRCQSGIPPFVVDLPITYQKDHIGNAPDVRDRHYVKMPAARNVQVLNDFGRSYSLDFSFATISQQLNFLSGRVSAAGRGGCLHLNSGRWSNRVRYLWQINQPASPDACYDIDLEGLGSATVSAINFGAEFRLVMPRPIGMPQGIYRGSVDYSIGPGGDFDFGNGVSNLSDTRLTINFELDVQHDLYLEFPAGSERAVLEPPGGWRAWLGGRGTPSKLYRDMPLRIWTTGPIRVYKRCEYELGDQCGIRESAGHLVGVDVSVTLPAGLQHNGRPIERLAIPTREPAALLIEPLSAVWKQPGQLHFEVAGSNVPAMLAHPGSRYEGLVTVVIEAQM